MTVRFELRGPLGNDTYSLVVDGNTAEEVIENVQNLAKNAAFSAILGLDEEDTK